MTTPYSDPSTKSNATRTHVATTTWRQIPVMTKMACGLREATAVSETELRAKCLRGRHYVFVNLDPSDTYTVRFVRIKRNRSADKPLIELVEEVTRSDVYNDMLGEMIYGMTHGLIK